MTVICSFKVSLEEQKLLVLMEFHFISFFFSVTFWYLRNFYLTQGYKGFSPMFSSRNFIVAFYFILPFYFILSFYLTQGCKDFSAMFSSRNFIVAFYFILPL